MVEYIFLLPKYVWKFHQKKKMGVFFLFHFLYKGHFKCKSMEIGIIEVAITLILKHYKAHLDL